MTALIIDIHPATFSLSLVILFSFCVIFLLIFVVFLSYPLAMMMKYVFLSSLLFNISIVLTLLFLQLTHHAARHPMIWVEMVTLLLFGYEVLREISILYGGTQPVIDSLRIQMYAVEHILLGLVLREAWLYYEKAHQRNTRKRSRPVS